MHKYSTSESVDQNMDEYNVGIQSCFIFGA